MSALLPCPFCGGKAIYTPTCHIDVVQCRVCGAQGMAAMGQHDAAIAAWNRRAGDDEVEKLREALRAVVADANGDDNTLSVRTANMVLAALGDTA